MKRMLAALMLAAALGGAACDQVAKDSDKVLAAIDRTEQVARSFTYSEATTGHGVVVAGAVRDDLRYRLDASIDGQPAASEIVYDDARAVRVDSTAGVGLFPASSASSTAAATTAASTSLKTGVWLEDPLGASSLAISPAPDRPGGDPFLDALTALDYVRSAVAKAQTVQLYNPQSETYRPRLDIFPKPSAGVLRYDLMPPDLPPRQRVGQGGNIGLQNQVPGVPFFRLMSIYVRGGLIVDVREAIAIQPRLVDSQSNLQERIGDFTKAASASSPVNVQAAALLFSINRDLQREGQPLIRPRMLDLSFTGLGRAPDVSLPAGASQTDLTNLGTYGLVLYESH